MQRKSPDHKSRRSTQASSTAVARHIAKTIGLEHARTKDQLTAEEKIALLEAKERAKRQEKTEIVAAKVREIIQEMLPESLPRDKSGKKIGQHEVESTDQFGHNATYTFSYFPKGHRSYQGDTSIISKVVRASGEEAIENTQSTSVEVFDGSADAEMTLTETYGDGVYRRWRTFTTKYEFERGDIPGVGNGWGLRESDVTDAALAFVGSAQASATSALRTEADTTQQ